MIAGIAASAALAISDIPWAGPIAMGRVGIDEKGEFKMQPTEEELKKSPLDLVVSTTAENVVMIEAGAQEIDEEKMLAAIAFGKKNLAPIAAEIAKIAQEIGRPKFELEEKKASAELVEEVEKKFGGAVEEFLKIDDKSSRERRQKELFVECGEEFPNTEEEGSRAKFAAGALDKLIKKSIRRGILERKERMGGRAMDEIRPLAVEVGVFERLHGSAVFQRGDTQAFSSVTVGGPGDTQLLDDIFGERKERFFHHYTFAPFCVGEADGRLFANHGALAERAVRPMLPPVEEFPYTLRVVSEILSSNGSSSMAATCGCCLALMDAGVPLKKPVAGVAMGMVAEEDLSRFEILTDLQGEEDFSGDMDFKVAGTKEGITAIQMDIKVNGLTPEIFEKALAQAKVGRLKILDAMTAALPAPRKEMSPHAPRITSFAIPSEKIGAVIGKGGETIQKISAECEVQIDLEENDERTQGIIFITGVGEEGTRRAKEWIEQLTYEPEVGDIIDGKVVRTTDFGAFIQLAPGLDGLCHISQLAKDRVERTEDVVKVGDTLKVKVLEKNGDRISLSHKVLLGGGDARDGKKSFGKSRDENGDHSQESQPRRGEEDPRPPMNKKPHETDPGRPDAKVAEKEF
jgi:polyribonucleotide nucleotidyltransferase